MHPKEIHLDRERSHLAVTWENGETTIYSADLLRTNARDAGSVRDAIDGRSAQTLAGLTITAIEPIGNYAVRLTFSDGHDRGIFPWSYLLTMPQAGLPPSPVTAP